MSDGETDQAPGFDEFVETEFTNVLALALALLGNRDDAVDVAQETMAQTFAHWDDVAAMDLPGAWARRVRQRDVVVLHYVDDLAVADIATILEVPEGTVKSDLSRARDRLRSAVTRRDDEGSDR